MTQFINVQNLWTDISLKGIQITHMWRCKISLFIREMQVQPRWATASHPLGWPQWKGSGRCWRGWVTVGTLILPVRILNSTATWENALEVPQKINHKVTIWPSNSSSKHIPERNKHMGIQKLWLCVHSSILHNSPKVETVQMSIKLK